MSRRAPGPDRAEQNRATLKQLVKLEANKSCADCKRNKHPRWASWNIGVFICIRCSGIHRGMGTHVSRVKSVDLDSWTDEQLASMLRWGNARANVYWENKLATGHVPNEAKIENFIRTKYDSKRWVMDGPMPDPSSLDVEGANDDDVPLNVVQEKAKLSRDLDGPRNGGVGGGSAAALPLSRPPSARPQNVDLFGDTPETVPARANTAVPTALRSGPPKTAVAAPKQTRPGESLLGLDFFGGTQSAPPTRTSTVSPSNAGLPGRTDLKQSILSLYAARPAASSQPQSPASFAGMQPSPSASPGPSALGGLGDAFGSLSFGSPATQASKPAPFSNFSPPTGHARQGSGVLSGGGFFDAKPAPPKVTSPLASPPPATMAFAASDFGDFSAAPAPAPAPVAANRAPPQNAMSMGDLFDLDPSPAPSSRITPAISTPTATNTYASSPAPNYSSSAFNLSQPKSTPAPAPPSQTSSMSASAAFNNMDAWGSSDAWATPETSTPAAAAPPAPPKPQSAKQTPAHTPSAFDSGWGDPEPAVARSAAPAAGTSTSGAGFAVQQDEEFGGWSHASPVPPSSGPKQGGLGGNADDLFGNVWG